MTVSTPPDGEQPVDPAPAPAAAPSPAPPSPPSPPAPAPDDHDPWRPPSPGQAPAPWGPPLTEPPFAPQPGNAMAVAALVLGVLGVVLGLVILLFWMSWLPALLAVIFGSVGLSQARKGRARGRGMALAGVILGGFGLLIATCAGLFFFLAAQKAADDNRARAERAAEAKSSAEAREKARHLSFGGSYTFGNGLKVTVAKPKPFVPDGYVLGHAKGNKAVQVTITVVNTGTERVEVETGLPRVNDADGASTELVIDGSGRQKVITGYVLPGRETVGKYAFSLPPDAADRMEVEFTPDAKRWQRAYWSGPTELTGK
ncbi:DUF4190 domain-containing protein [Streptomyces sp. NPDC018045]|uniref:DUF4190 domain-containing protein n=1 Tax=Streptomyces sp. NPDC018045 TaxID=3365037 RepID=UPI003795C97A